jgi:D-alanyl-D-alanine carboxypeptidase/D-alanyl-D-alanine-endopeptidase (penicillin-binding protein 4)
MKKVAILLVLFFTVSLFGVGDIPYDLNHKLRAIPLNSNSYSIYVKSVNSDTPIVSWNSYKSRVPASVIKLLTVYSGLLGLGYDYRWETKFYSTGYIRNRTLFGDLFVKASGDPTLGSSDLDDIVNNLHQLGIRKILGNIVIDRTLFSVPRKNNSGFDRNRYSPYNAMPDAMMFNERKSKLCVTPHGRTISINRLDGDSSYKVINRLKVVNGSCKKGRSWPRVKIRTDSSQRSVITLSGKLSKRCGRRTICKVVSMPHRSFYYALKDRLKKEGIKFTGTLRLKRVPRKAKYLFSHSSKRLEDVISIIAKHSNNLMARQLFLTIGTQFYSPPINTLKASRAIKRILNRYSILEGKTIISNGSGLSRTSRVTAKTLANLLEHGYLNYGHRWMNTLSVAGIDGTIRRRFKNSTVYGRAWMKTGTIKHVSNIAGYVEGSSGEIYVVVVLVNDKKSAMYGRRLANSVIKWVADRL